MKKKYFIALALVVFAVLWFLPRIFAGSIILPATVGIGSFTIHYYGIMHALGLLVGVGIITHLGKRYGIAEDKMFNLVYWVVPIAYASARLYYVLFEWQQYADSWWHALYIWEGGLAIHGGLLGGAFGLWLYARRNKLSFLRLADIISPAIVLATGFGRWGNFFNQEAFGRPTSLPWKLFISPEHRPVDFFTSEYFHPTFLYEFLWDVAVFALLFYLFKRFHNARPGTFMLVYFGAYSFGRFFTEALRTDSLYAGPVRMAQLISASVFVISCSVLAYWFLRYKKQESKNLPK